ncbi:Serine/threonine-protein kinase KIN3 [Hanseniaspora osmophila]|uniref:non-specific serine/threonine protein kinase n=1 Tax=Hanseniaspora osmophila TaxID=56408 RepID=A0A1E5R4P8_9ASCO|nr:Serine/threonine-protein kinase KIN3 [Hanseniaspora osmophila]
MSRISAGNKYSNQFNYNGNGMANNVNPNTLNKRYQVLETIGSGSFGSVKKIYDYETGTYLVRKDIKFAHMSLKERQQLINECKILSSLKHNNIVEFVSFDYDTDTVYIYMEYCDGGDLAKLIEAFREKKKRIPELIVWRILVQVSLALWRCHYGADPPLLGTVFDKLKKPDNSDIASSQIVIHRDLKPGNIFLTNLHIGPYGSSSSTTTTTTTTTKSNSASSLETSPPPSFPPYPTSLPPHAPRSTRTMSYSPNATPHDNRSGGVDQVIAKLGDFGLAKSLKSKNHFATTYVGTPYYMSPELLKDKPYSPLSDVWSLGCVLYEMCCLRPPFKGAKTFTELESRIVSGVYEPISASYYSKNLRTIIDRCIQVDLRKRYSVMDILNDIQAKIMYKSLQLEMFESQLLQYEKELVNIEKHLEQRYMGR